MKINNDGSWFVIIYDTEAETDSVLFLVDSEDEGHEYITKSFNYHIEILDYISKDNWKENAEILHSVCMTNPIEEYYVNDCGRIFFAGLYYKEGILDCKNKYAVVLASTYGYFDIYVHERSIACIRRMKHLYRRANIDSEKIADMYDFCMEIDRPEIFARLKSGEEYFSHVYKIEKPSDKKYNPSKPYTAPIGC